MEFVDETRIRVRSGNGGDGCVAFRRERNVPLGGPSGGDGGDGGSVLLRADRNRDTLLPLARTRSFVARNGESGRGAHRNGKSADHLVVAVPVGTVVLDQDGRPLADLARHGQEVVLAHGGRGGHGNSGFKTAVNQSPREFTYGGDGLERLLRLELRLIADVGLLGFPNAGKSTLLSRFSAARPRIADYPFTTLQPQLGIVSDRSGERELVLADIPGIIEGAAEGAGMGLSFLRHVERCRLLLHLVDLCPLDGTYPWDNVRTIDRELERFSPTLAAKPRLLVGNKLDLSGAREALELMAAELGAPALGISAVSGEGLETLRIELFRRLAELPKPEPSSLSAMADLDAGGARVGAKAVRTPPRRGGRTSVHPEGEADFFGLPDEMFEDDGEFQSEADETDPDEISAARPAFPETEEREGEEEEEEETEVEGDKALFVPENPDDVFDTRRPPPDEEADDSPASARPSPRRHGAGRRGRFRR